MSDQPRWIGWHNDTPATLLQAFGDVLSDLSEFCWCAGWQEGTTETVRYRLRVAQTTGIAQGWGQHDQVLTPELARVLYGMAWLLGGWPMLNPDEEGPRYVLWNETHRAYSEADLETHLRNRRSHLAESDTDDSNND